MATFPELGPYSLIMRYCPNFPLLFYLITQPISSDYHRSPKINKALRRYEPYTAHPTEGYSRISPYFFNSSSSSSTVFPLSFSAAMSASYFSFSAFFASLAFAIASCRRAFRSSAVNFATDPFVGLFIAATRRSFLAFSFSSASWLLASAALCSSSFASVSAIRVMRSSFSLVSRSIV